jgi:hypothetical protein
MLSVCFYGGIFKKTGTLTINRRTTGTCGGTYQETGSLTTDRPRLDMDPALALKGRQHA